MGTGRAENPERLFVAIELPEPVRQELGSLGGGMAGVKWTPVEQLHLTLRFIGEVGPETGGQIRSQLASVPGEPLNLTIEGLGSFPPKGRPKVLWAGVGGEQGALLALQDRIESALLEIGLQPQDRPFHPHITLGRNREASPRVLHEWLQTHADLSIPSFSVHRFALFSSRLTRQGAIHTKEREYGLTTG